MAKHSRDHFLVDSVLARNRMKDQSIATTSSGRLWYMAALLCLTNAIAFIDRQSLPLLVDQIKGDLQITDTQVSYLVGLAFVISYVGFGVPAGMLVDRFPRRAVMAFGIVFWSA